MFNQHQSYYAGSGNDHAHRCTEWCVLHGQKRDNPNFTSVKTVELRKRKFFEINEVESWLEEGLGY